MLLLEPTTSWTREPKSPKPCSRPLIGSYQIQRRIGAGGMGIVYEALAEESGRTVALKIPNGNHADPRTRSRQLRQEAETLAGLRHPSIVRVHDMGRTEDGQDFFTMELVRGVALTVWRRRFRDPLSGEELHAQLLLLRRICQAVAFAHRNGVAHLDLKPANIIVDDGSDHGRAQAKPPPTDKGEGQNPGPGARRRGMGVKLLDFGLARRFKEKVKGKSRIPRRRKSRGTLAYMSPEQALGREDLLDARSDVYALGVIAYEMLTGRMPVDLDSCHIEESLEELLNTRPTPLGKLDDRLSGDLEVIVLRALEKDPMSRYATANELLSDLDRFLSRRPIRPRHPYRGLHRLLLRPEAALRLMWLTLILSFSSTLLLSLFSRLGWLGG